MKTKRGFLYFINGTEVLDDSERAMERYQMYKLADEQYERKQRFKRNKIKWKLKTQRKIGTMSISIGIASLLLGNIISGMLILVAPALISGCILWMSKCVVV